MIRLPFFLIWLRYIDLEVVNLLEKWFILILLALLGWEVIIIYYRLLLIGRYRKLRNTSLFTAWNKWLHWLNIMMKRFVLLIKALLLVELHIHLIIQLTLIIVVCLQLWVLGIVFKRSQWWLRLINLFFLEWWWAISWIDF